MAKYRYAVGFWLSVAAAAWTLMAIGAGFNAIANNGKYVNGVMITTLVLLAALTALFVWLALRFRRRTPRFANPS